MVKLAFQVYAFIAILSPWVFLILKLLGIYNFQYDCLIFLVLFIFSGIVMFLTFKRW